MIEQRRLIEQQQVEEVRITKKKAEAFACKRCFVKFSNNTKLHQYIQNHHQKKIEKSVANEFAKLSSFSFITSSEIVIFTSKITSKALISISTSFSTSKIKIATFTFFFTLKVQIATSTFSEFIMSTTSIATSRKSIFWVEITSRSIIASKSSRLSISTSKRVSNIAKIASIIYSFTSSSIFSQESISKHQNSRIRKFYLTLNDLYRMFVEKHKSIDLSQHQIRRSFSSNVNSCHSIQRNLIQINITFYFKSAVNQNKSISQNSKSSNSKSFQQYTLAKSNRIKFTLNKWFEKSIILSYKTSIFSRLFISKTSSVSSYKLFIVTSMFDR